MSSLRKAVSRRAHKERQQPSHRTRLGLLEKHKDYVQRAQDFHKKEQRIQKLREKAVNRNPDEFYFKMINSKVVNSVHRSNSGKVYTEEELQVMRRQDAGYLMSKAQSEQKKVERLRSSILPLNGNVNNHLFFVDEADDIEETRKQVVNRPPEPQRVPKVRKKVTREIEERNQRAEKLRSMAATMNLQKQLTGKGRKRKLRTEELDTPSETPVYKWKTERKR